MVYLLLLYSTIYVCNCRRQARGILAGDATARTLPCARLHSRICRDVVTTRTAAALLFCACCWAEEEGGRARAMIPLSISTPYLRSTQHVCDVCGVNAHKLAAGCGLREFRVSPRANGTLECAEGRTGEVMHRQLCCFIYTYIYKQLV